MAAYAAAVSLMHIIDLLKNHPSPPICFDRQQFDSLSEIVTFLQEFLESYVSPFSYSDEADPLEMRIADAAYAAEDVIESYIVDTIHLADAAATHHEDEQIRYINFYEGLWKVIEAMDLIKKEAMEMKWEKAGHEAELLGNVSAEGGFKSSSTESKSHEMVGFEDELLDLKDRLVGGDSNRQIIPIVGMGGIGKTTLARNVFADKLIVEHFDICVWSTISLDHDIERTLREVLSHAKGTVGTSGDNSVAGLGEELYKCLFGRRYLVVMDDMWSIEVWDKIGSFFPDCGEGSRIIVTTRMSNVADLLSSSSNSICLSFLNRVDSWTLFSKIVFGIEGSDPDLELELREIGEKIVVKCRGLPLSIVVVGGLLVKSERTQGYWEYIEKNLSSRVILDNEEYCLRILKLSYNHLPAYLKPCFLYLGMFDEDSEIEISTIIKLWVSDGFVKPNKKKNLETVAREYFQELVDRNLLLALSNDELANRELGSFGMTKLCKMHDLIRDLSLREAQKQRFYHVYSEEHDPSSHPHRRIVIPDKTIGDVKLESSPNLRSYVCYDRRVGILLNFRLLRTLHSQHEYRLEDVFGLVNARLLSIVVEHDEEVFGSVNLRLLAITANVLHSSISRLWSLHTLLVYSREKLIGPVEFWNMHQLKHVEFTDGRLSLPLPNNDNNIVILENLHTLIGMTSFHLTEDVVKRIPNLTILDVSYDEILWNREVHCLSYLQRLSKLESFRCSIQDYSDVNLQKICFPHSLKQILLQDFGNPEWDGVLAKIGQLAFVEDLLIHGGFFRGSEWETTEGQFPRLRRLELVGCGGMKKWIVSEASHFPVLQKIVLIGLRELEEIPSELGEIATLEGIEVRSCSRSAMLSAKKIVEEQVDSYGEEQLSFRVLVVHWDEKLQSLATPNFQVERTIHRRSSPRSQRKPSMLGQKQEFNLLQLSKTKH